MNLAEVATLCRTWQERLRLRDWQVSVVPADVYAMGKAERSAHVVWDLCEKAAELSVLPADHPALRDCLVRQDEETGVVHELLHLCFAPLPQPSAGLEETLFEQALNAIAAALVALARRTEED